MKTRLNHTTLTSALLLKAFSVGTPKDTIHLFEPTDQFQLSSVTNIIHYPEQQKSEGKAQPDQSHYPPDQN